MNQLLVIAEEGEREMAEKLFPDTPVLVTGIGAINIINALKEIPRDTPLINVGYAGSANYNIGTWVRVTQAFLHHPNITYPEPELKLNLSPSTFHLSPLIDAPCYTSVDFVLASPYKDCVFDMEIAFILAMGFTNVQSYKYVSDNLSYHEYKNTTAGN